MGPIVSLKEEILALKKQKNAVILAHYYEDGDVQDIADHVGDSLYLAQAGEKLTAPVALMAGVVFMAETVKILSPTKTVLVPDLGAGCSLVDHSPFDQYLKWRRQHPTGVAVTYVNSSAAVKSITDVTCTSSNAEKIIAAVPPGRPILFGPDRNLGRYLAKKMGKKIGTEMILWPGACQVHVLFSARKLYELKRDNPGVPILAHPECDEVVLAHADVIGSTSRLLEETQKNPAKKFIVATEEGIFHQMKKSRPDAEFIQAPAEGSCACNQCPYMKMNTLEKVRNALRDLKPQIEVPADIIEKSRVPLRRMLDITSGLKVEWPNEFRE
jgi:quinolinate synthase